MIRNNKVRLFGPLKPSHFDGPYYQRGEGIASFFSGLLRKVVPYAGKAIKSLASSDIAKKTTKILSKNATSALGDIVADVIEGKNPIETAKEKLQKTREDIAETIRDNSKSDKEKKPTKRKKPPVKNVSRKKRRKYYIFDE